MKYLKRHLSTIASVAVFSLAASLLFQSCVNKISKGKNAGVVSISENDFRTVPDSVKPWVYYWWLKGNVTKEQLTRDLEEMKAKGVGGFLLFDSRGYWDSYDGKTGHIPVPLNVKHEFMSPGWREMVKFAMQEAHRLGLKMSINLANTGGSLRGPWNMKENRAKQLIWTTSDVRGPAKVSAQLDIPADKKYFQDVALLAVRIKSKDSSLAKGHEINLNGEWKTVSAPTENAPVAGEVVDLRDKISNGKLLWDAPDGNWQIIRFGFQIIGEEGGVDILNSGAVTQYFNLMGSEILKDAGPLAGVTLTYFYNVSWEGGQPDWTVGFEKEFKKYRGYDIRQYLPVLAGLSLEDRSLNERFMRDYLKTVSDCFMHNCYETIGNLCHAKGILWHSEDGGPWPRNAPMFKEADQLTFWGKNDMPQGEFWCSDLNDLGTKSNVRYAAMAGHIYGQPLIAVEAFTHMGRHWTKYPAYLKPFADINLIDGANFFIWHTFTASPLEVGKPGYEYFAGTHINPNVTWWDKAGNFFDYLGRCQSMLRKGKFVADVCCYVSDKNYVMWGRGEKWNPNSTLTPVRGFSYDLLSSEVLTERLSVKDGKLVLPDGMSYSMLVVDLTEPVIPVAVLEKVKELIENGATVVLGKNKPIRPPGISSYPECDKKMGELVENLWSEDNGQLQIHSLGKGKIITGPNMEEVLRKLTISPDFEGPFQYIHRKGENFDIYFVSGEGKSDCTFRINDRKPEIWDPITGKTSEAISYRQTSDGRTIVPLTLDKNGSTFVVFREKASSSHLTSVSGPENTEWLNIEGTSNRYIFWQSGDYLFSLTNGASKKVTASVLSPVVISNSWNVTFEPATEAKKFDSTFNELTLWNENSSPEIKYFSGSATYSSTFTLNDKQAKSPARVQFCLAHDIARVWVNGKDLGVVWTFPWQVNLTGSLREGINELKIEVTNCWANRLIGDAGLPENQWTTKTNVRRVPDRSVYKEGHQAFSAKDELMPSGLVGPVQIEFGVAKEITF